MLCRICAYNRGVQIQSVETFLMDDADRTAPTRQHELLIDYTDLPWQV